MRRTMLGLLVSLALAVLDLGVARAQQLKPVGPGSVEFTTPQGVDFRFGMSLEFQPTSVTDLDFNDDKNFKTITEFGSTGEEDLFVGVETRLFFSVAKDRVSLYTAVELDGTLDSRSIDANNPNIERLNLSLLLPEIASTFTVGADIYALDQIGGLVYIDDDPGLFLRGSAGPLSWQFGYHKRIDFGGQAGDSGGRFAARAGVDEDREDDTDIFSAKVGYDLRPGLHISPFFLAYLRNTPMSGPEQNRLGAVGPGGAPRPADPLQAVISGDRIQPSQQSYFLGLQGTALLGFVRASGEFVYLTGEIDGLVDRTTGALPFGRKSFDIDSFAAYLRLDFDISKRPWWPLRGIIPFVSAEFLRGDDDPFDSDLEGFVSVSSPNGLRPGDLPFLRKTVLGLGSPVVGDGTADFGFGVDGRGIGPTIGNILEGATFPSSNFFNNRFGKGDNPGYLKLSAGLQGAFSPSLELHVAGQYLRFDQTEPIEAEFRAFNIGSVDEEIGGGIDVVFVWKPQPQYQLRPFFSIFFPGDGTKKIAGDDSTAIVGGVNFFAFF